MLLEVSASSAVSLGDVHHLPNGGGRQDPFLQVGRCVTASSNMAVASRIRGLLSGQGNPRELAARLGVDEMALRISIDELSPYPTIGVISAIIREYGVDPSWLLTGNYSASAHREILETNADELPLKVAQVARRSGMDTPGQLRIVRDA